jgi:NADPH2:quinone reductase
MSITFDDIGPERIHQFYDPASGMRAALVIDRTFPLSEAAEAHRYVGQRKNRGKVLLIP